MDKTLPASIRLGYALYGFYSPFLYLGNNKEKSYIFCFFTPARKEDQNYWSKILGIYFYLSTKVFVFLSQIKIKSKINNFLKDELLE